MRICYIINTLATGGAENMLVRHIDWMANKHDQYVLVLGSKSDLEDDIKNVGVDVEKLEIDSIKKPEEFFRAVKAVSDVEPDIYHSHLPRPIIIGAVASLCTGIPIVSTHHSIQRSPLETKYNVTKLVSLATNMNVGVSPSVTESREPFLSSPCSSWKTIPNAIDFGDFGHSSGQTTDNDSSQVITSVGRYVPEKRHSLFIHAISRLRELDYDVEAKIVGWGPLEDELQQLVASLDLHDRVEVTGKVDDVCPYYQLSDAIALCGRQEGLPIVALEALACGTPLVGVNEPGITDVIDTRYGTTAADSSVIGLSKAIAKEIAISRNSKKIQQVGKQKFGKKSYTQKYNRVYSQVRNNSSS